MMVVLTDYTAIPQSAAIGNDRSRNLTLLSPCSEASTGMKMAASVLCSPPGGLPILWLDGGSEAPLLLHWNEQDSQNIQQ